MLVQASVNNWNKRDKKGLRINKKKKKKDNLLCMNKVFLMSASNSNNKNKN